MIEGIEIQPTFSEIENGNEMVQTGQTCQMVNRVRQFAISCR